MPKEKLVNVVIKQLSKWGVKNIYGYAGDTILKFFSALKDSPIKLYTTKHEGAAGLMASAESKLRGKLSVCVAHGGPGTANIINGIADAYSDQTPVLLITGGVSTWNMGTNYKQVINQRELTNPLTVFSAAVTNPDSIVDLLVKAMSKAIAKGGVSHLIVPMDMWEAKTDAEPREYLTHLDQKQTPEEESISEAVKEINGADKPIILYGRGAKGCQDELIKLADKIKAGLIHTLPAKGIVNTKNQVLSLGGLGHAGSYQVPGILQEADLILLFGATWWPMDYVPRRPQVIQFDEVKDNIGVTHPVKLGVVGSVKPALDLITERVEGKDNQEWSNRINNARKEWLDNLEEKIQPVKAPLSPQSIMDLINSKIKENEIICLDSGDSVVWFGKYFINDCEDILVSGTWRTMGFALPAALAAKINYPEKPITCIIGDGGVGMVMGEILTGLRYDLPIRVIVLNNGTLAMEKNKMISADLLPEEVDLTNPDFVKLVKSCGGKGIKINSIEELEKILEETKQLDEMVVIDVPTTAPMPTGTKL